MAMKKEPGGAVGRPGKRARAAGTLKKPVPGRAAAAAARRPSPAADHTKQTIRRLRKELAQAQRRVEELQAAADTDFLLDIPNRRGFERELDRAIAYIRRYRASGALIMLDVDRLKPINDTFGHAAGDQVLKA